MKNRILLLTIYSAFIVVLGMIISGYGFMTDGKIASYAQGFGIGLGGVGLLMLIRNLILLKNPKKRKIEQINSCDERNQQILLRSYAITFRITLLIEAVTCIVLVFVGEIVYSEIIGCVLSIQLLISLISHIILSRKF